MNIIIVGCGKVGRTLAEQLSQEGHNISIIDINQQVVDEISYGFDAMGVTGNGASWSTQMEAGIEKAHLLIAVTGSDELNLLCCLIARKAGNCKTIARVRNPVYSKDVAFIKEELGLTLVINPEYEAACEISRLLKFPSAIDINIFKQGHVELLKFKVEENSVLHDMKIKEIHTRLKCDILISIVERGEETIIPNGDFVIKENDIISIVGSRKMAMEFFVRIGVVKAPVKNAILIGGGAITYYLATQLLNSGINVKIIEEKRKRCEELTELLPKAMIIHGDGTDKELLMEEGITDAEAFVSLTGMDEENILLSLYARCKMNGKIITKVNRIAFDEVVDSLNLGSVVYPKYITLQSILKYVRAMNHSRGSNVENIYKIKKDKAEALGFLVNKGSKLIGISLENLDLKPNIIICSINRNGTIIIPNGKDCIEEGDHVLIVTTNMGLHDISDILRS